MIRLVSLRRDERGSVLVIGAIALLVILAMMGSGLDLGRAYMTRQRLQQACDAGALNGRAELSGKSWDSGPHDQANAIFAANFPAGTYSSDSLAYAYEIVEGKKVQGTASANVPTTLMRLFGFASMPVSVTCDAETQLPNVDIMLVLDTTDTMTTINPGDSISRIAAMRQAVLNFYNSIEANKVGGGQTRYGFVPYASNVNVGSVLKPAWLANSWTYQSRRNIVSASNPDVPDETQTLPEPYPHTGTESHIITYEPMVSETGICPKPADEGYQLVTTVYESTGKLTDATTGN